MPDLRGLSIPLDKAIAPGSTRHPRPRRLVSDCKNGLGRRLDVDAIRARELGSPRRPGRVECDDEKGTDMDCDFGGLADRITRNRNQR